MESETRVLVVAGDPLARAGLATVLTDEAGCQVVGQMGLDETGLVAALAGLAPDVAVVDLGWEPEEGLAAVSELAEEGVPVLALLPDEELAAAARAAGARGLVGRAADGARLGVAVAAVVGGLVVSDPDLASAIVPAGETGLAPPVVPLTPREREVLQLVADGLSNRAIAHRLEISEHTVKFHVNAVLGKLGAGSRTEAAVRAARLGLVTL